MEPFLVGAGIGCLIGVAGTYLVVSRPRPKKTLSWLELLDEQEASFEGSGAACLREPEHRAVTRLTNRERTVVL